MEGVVDVLAELTRLVRMAIVTTAKRADFDLIHEKRGIRQFMEFVLAREDYANAKPHPEPYLTGLRRFGVTADEALVVEDSARGLKSAVAAGIDCAVVHNEFTKGQDFARASYRIGTLAELTDIIERLAARSVTAAPAGGRARPPRVVVSRRACGRSPACAPSPC
ncbi:HAD family hydrolase [Actinoplanes sp. KI2]|nr:HAD family hydrolase [Actinoplanes sp. KI2]MCU7726483.1 HAD family hydrolase [Actinoplanes sp. KI2]